MQYSIVKLLDGIFFYSLRLTNFFRSAAIGGSSIQALLIKILAPSFEYAAISAINRVYITPISCLGFIDIERLYSPMTEEINYVMKFIIKLIEKGKSVLV